MSSAFKEQFLDQPHPDVSGKSDAQLIQILENLSAEVHGALQLDIGAALPRLQEIMDIKFDPLVASVGTMEKCILRFKESVLRFIKILLARNLIGNETEKTQLNTAKVNQIYCAMDYVQTMSIANMQQQRLRTTDVQTLLTLDNMLFSPVQPSMETLLPYQQLIVHAGKHFYLNRYRRYQDQIYEEIRVAVESTEDGHLFYRRLTNKQQPQPLTRVQKRPNSKTMAVYTTHAWESHGQISEVLNQLCVMTNVKLWNLATLKRDNINAVSEYYKTCASTDFPNLLVNRNCRSFHNGLLDIDFDDADNKTAGFYVFGASTIPAEIVSCKFFEQEFNTSIMHHKNWWYVPTPTLDQIFIDQRLSNLVCCHLQAQIGRLLYSLNHHDQWQVILFIKGVANSGKSVLGHTVKTFYNVQDVAIMSSNIEQKFGLEGIFNKLLFICFEVTKSWGLARSDFQSLISGEELSIARKNRLAITERWTTPGILFGNELGPWSDAAGSIVRRLLVAEFDRPITKNVDTTLEQKLKAEIGNVIYKCQQGYVTSCRKYSGKGLLSQMPEYFKRVSSRIATETNPIREFIRNSGYLVPDPESTAPYIAVQTCLYHFLNTGRTNEKFTKQSILSAFEHEGLQVTTQERKLANGQTRKELVVVGVALSMADDSKDSKNALLENAMERERRLDTEANQKDTEEFKQFIEESSASIPDSVIFQDIVEFSDTNPYEQQAFQSTLMEIDHPTPATAPTPAPAPAPAPTIRHPQKKLRYSFGSLRPSNSSSSSSSSCSVLNLQNIDIEECGFRETDFID